MGWSLFSGFVGSLLIIIFCIRRGAGKEFTGSILVADSFFKEDSLPINLYEDKEEDLLKEEENKELLIEIFDRSFDPSIVSSIE